MGTNQSSIQRIIPLIVLLAVVPIGSCSDDDPVSHEPPPPACVGLETTCPRDNVLKNLHRSYNERNINRYDELLDDDFVFYFSAEDVLNGTPAYWSRASEIRVNRNMFNPNYSNPTQEPVQDIDLSLVYPQGDDQWTPIEPEDQVTYPGETWYQKIVIYNLTVQLPGDFQYVGLNKQAAFVLRVATKDSKEYWQIVVWRDDTGTGYNGLDRTGRVMRADQRTWGSIKARYSG